MCMEGFWGPRGVHGETGLWDIAQHCACGSSSGGLSYAPLCSLPSPQQTAISAKYNSPCEQTRLPHSCRTALPALSSAATP